MTPAPEFAAMTVARRPSSITLRSGSSDPKPCVIRPWCSMWSPRRVGVPSTTAQIAGRLRDDGWRTGPSNPVIALGELGAGSVVVNGRRHLLFRGSRFDISRARAPPPHGSGARDHSHLRHVRAVDRQSSWSSPATPASPTTSASHAALSRRGAAATRIELPALSAGGPLAAKNPHDTTCSGRGGA